MKNLCNISSFYLLSGTRGNDNLLKMYLFTRETCKDSCHIEDNSILLYGADHFCSNTCNEGFNFSCSLGLLYTTNRDHRNWGFVRHGKVCLKKIEKSSEIIERHFSNFFKWVAHKHLDEIEPIVLVPSNNFYSNTNNRRASGLSDKLKWFFVTLSSLNIRLRFSSLLLLLNGTSLRFPLLEIMKISCSK